MAMRTVRTHLPSARTANICSSRQMGTTQASKTEPVSRLRFPILIPLLANRLPRQRIHSNGHLSTTFPRASPSNNSRLRFPTPMPGLHGIGPVAASISQAEETTVSTSISSPGRVGFRMSLLSCLAIIPTARDLGRTTMVPFSAPPALLNL
jgi:hypothetical protein